MEFLLTADICKREALKFPNGAYVGKDLVPYRVRTDPRIRGKIKRIKIDSNSKHYNRFNLILLILKIAPGLLFTIENGSSHTNQVPWDWSFRRRRHSQGNHHV